MDVGDSLRLSDAQEVIASFERPRMIGERFATKCGLIQLEPLDHRAHCAVEKKYSVRQQSPDLLFSVHAALFRFSGKIGRQPRAIKISAGRLPLRASFSPA